MLHLKFIYRQITSSLKQTTVFVLCVALSIVTLVALGGFGDSVNDSLLRDARKLLAGDIIIESGFPLERPLLEGIDRLTAAKRVEKALIYEFLTIVRLPDAENTLLTSLKVVENGYPFYGEVELESGRPLAEALTSGNIIVEANLLERLGVSVGDQLLVGSTQLTIADVLIFEPDRPVDFFAFGPRVFASAADLAAMQLIRPGSRIEYKVLLKVNDEAQLNEVRQQLEAAANPRQERLETFRTARTGVQAFFDNFILFLSLIGIFTLMLAGIGIQSSLSAFLKEREQTIAILRTFGATGRFVMHQFFAVAAALGILGTILGLLLSFLLQVFFPTLFARFLPPNIELVISGRAIIEALLLGSFVVTAFTFLPIYQIQALKPSFIFQKQTLPIPKGWVYYGTIALIIGFFLGMVLWYLEDTRTGLYFVGGTLGLILVTAVITRLALGLLRKRRLHALAARQALRGLFRPRNATAAIVITLSASLAVLFAIFLIEQNLDASFVDAFPDNAPNLVILDIQPDQVEDVAAELGDGGRSSHGLEFFPIVRGRIDAINGQSTTEIVVEPVSEGQEAEQARPPRIGRRTFSLTYRDHLRPNESLLSGASLFESAEPDLAQVSVLADFLENQSFEIGDILLFNIQGVQLPARVTSIRTFVDDGSIQPAFTFVLRPQDLVNAPQTIFTTLTIPKDEVPALQNRLIAQFPNLTIINIGSTIETFAAIARDVTTIIRFFTLFSIIAGVLIIISSVLATRFARIQEAVYFKVLGAKRRFVLEVFTLENVFLGLLSAALALLLSQVGSYILIMQVFELERYRGFWGASLLLAAGTVVLVTAVGLLASISILQKKPIVFLREQTDE